MLVFYILNIRDNSSVAYFSCLGISTWNVGFFLKLLRRMEYWLCQSRSSIFHVTAISLVSYYFVHIETIARIMRDDFWSAMAYVTMSLANFQFQIISKCLLEKRDPQSWTSTLHAVSIFRLSTSFVNYFLFYLIFKQTKNFYFL